MIASGFSGMQRFNWFFDHTCDLFHKICTTEFTQLLHHYLWQICHLGSQGILKYFMVTNPVTLWINNKRE